MVIHKNLKWLKPYLKSIKSLVPLKKLRAINAYTVPLNKQELNEATITKVNNKYSINLKVTVNNPYLWVQRKPFIAQILENLAHEAAHMKHWSHDHNHFMLQAKILQKFAKVLKKQGIKDTYRRIK